MLKTPTLHRDEITDMIANVRGMKSDMKHIEEGAVEIGHFSFDCMIWGGNAPKFYMGYPNFTDLNSYGVCDTPEQFLNKYREKLKKDKRTFVVSFTHIKKNPLNAGKGGGWRWHKWGPYVGKGKPRYEYLDDEDNFNNGVYVYQILQIEGPEFSFDFKTGKLVQSEEN